MRCGWCAAGRGWCRDAVEWCVFGNAGEVLRLRGWGEGDWGAGFGLATTSEVLADAVAEQLEE